jgi:hypothetical protein
MMYGGPQNLTILEGIYREKGVLKGNHRNGWQVWVHDGWRRKSTRVGAFKALGVDKQTSNPEYHQAGQFMKQGLLKGSHATGWFAQLDGSFTMFPTRRAAVQALKNGKVVPAPAHAGHTGRESGSNDPVCGGADLTEASCVNLVYCRVTINKSASESFATTVTYEIPWSTLPEDFRSEYFKNFEFCQPNFVWNYPTFNFWIDLVSIMTLGGHYTYVADILEVLRNHLDKCGHSKDVDITGGDCRFTSYLRCPVITRSR